MKATEIDRRYMALALRLAAKARGRTSPNPMVGAVVVARHRVVGQGYHRKAGGPHAEVLALRSAGKRARGATLYVTLEPCHHTGKRTPPCVPALIASGLRRVVVAMRDPNPLVSGRGLSGLRRAGIHVTVGCLRKEAERLNEMYAHWMRTSRPFVILKAAVTLDGKIAAASGESRWITGKAARRHAHRLRSQVDAVMVGIGTVLRDDPRLTARLGDGQSTGSRIHQPLRVVVDSRLRISPTARVLSLGTSTGPRSGVVVATTARAPRARIDRLRARGVSVAVLPDQQGRVSLRACMAHLGRMGVTSLLLEGGSELNASALKAGLVNRVLFYIAPTLVGGRDAPGVIGGQGPKRLAGALPMKDLQTQRLGSDFLVGGTLQRRRN